MSVNNIQNDFGANQSVFNDYKSDVSFFGESSKDNDVNGVYRNPSNTPLNYSLNPVYSINIDFLRNQSIQVYNYINNTINSLEKILYKIYLNETLTPNLQETHTKLWEELCKYNDITLPEPAFICFEEYKYAERSTSTVARRFIAEFNQVSSQSVFSYLLNFRTLLVAMLNEAYYIKSFILINFQEQYEDDAEKQVAVQFDSWAKAAQQCTQRIAESITSTPGEIPASELDKVTEKQAVEFQAFFAIRLEALNEEIINLLNNLKRDYVDNCNIFYDRYLTQSLNFKTKIVAPMEMNFYTTTFSSQLPVLSEELVIATNVMNGNFGMILSDLVQRNQIIRGRMERILDLIKDKRKYSNYIFQLSYKGQIKKIIVKKITEDSYSAIYKQSHITYKDQSDLLSDHGSLHNLQLNHHPQYLLTEGGTISGDVAIANNAKIDGVSISGHAHNGVDGTSKIKSTDIDYETPKIKLTGETPLPTSIEITEIKQDIIDGGVPVVDAIISLSINDLDLLKYEYEVSIYEV